jgi:arylsulfatase A-like enzyme
VHDKSAEACRQGHPAGALRIGGAVRSHAHPGDERHERQQGREARRLRERTGGFLAVHERAIRTGCDRRARRAGRERERDVRLVQNHAGYAAMLEQFDTALGRVFASLDKNGLTDRTIVIFTSDNGGLSTSEGHPTSNLPLRGGKGWPYEGGTRVAWIVSAPGITKPGTTCDTPVISTDHFATLLELSGLPALPTQHRDGVSFVRQLKGERTPRGQPLYWHYPHYGNQGGAPHGAVRDGDWKLIEWFEDNSVELYNIPGDISEKTNLAAQHPEKVASLRAKLIAWRTEVGALMPTPNPNYDPAAPAEPTAKKKNATKKSP